MTREPHVNNELAIALLLLTTHSISHGIVQGRIWAAVPEAITILIGALFFQLAIWLPCKSRGGLGILASKLHRILRLTRRKHDAEGGSGKSDSLE